MAKRHDEARRENVGLMADAKEPITIKKYANRRLYNTGTSTYVTLEDLAEMVKAGENFVVADAKTGEDITRAVLTQIIVEQESKGQNLLPVDFLRQLIRFYGDSLQGVVPGYLDMTMKNFTADQDRIRTQMAQAFGMPIHMFEEQARQNMAMFDRAFRMFSPFPSDHAEAARAAKPAAATAPGDLDTLRKQMAEMQKQLDAIAKK
jgi:polyhydroxyalkanoate synthesis repressor PhaR